ncbi:hypothetical protein QBC34DRAFT_132624 [Podospora aff. communis PSN243]|uniref:HNH nuclease domain-containing protein n=1 Tax=Podospora aff. communis PSN243 TaxID=3040156 RepID=A0AAV9GG70_9PEZI|nr:hypothetical protein QBC34DRAFT_132624 [Podospora aff. communis PSN243]
MLIESLIGSNFFGQLRSILQMSTSRDESSPPGGVGKPDESDRANASAKGPLPKMHRRNTKITRPEVGSLYDIMHENAGSSLYVVPICWTDLHSRLLGVQFQELPAITTPVPDYVPGRWLEPSSLARGITHELHVLCKKEASHARFIQKNKAIKHVLSTFFPGTLSHTKTGADLNLYFGNLRFKKAVRVACLWKSPSNANTSFDSSATVPVSSFIDSTPTNDYAPNKPMLAYVSRSQLSMIRKNLFRVVLGPNNTPNEPVSRLQRLRSKMLLPSNSDHDPYLVAVLIAMAQSHFYQQAAERSSSQSSTDSRNGRRKVYIIKPTHFHDVKVQLITHDEGDDATPNFTVYSATVSAAFLERFLHPDKAASSQTASGDGLQITHTPVPFWPILGLRERLAKALGREIAGDPLFSDPEYIALWDPLVEQPRTAYGYQAPPASFKRRRTERAPLSVVHNSSFDDDLPSTDDDSPVLSPSAKRRRTGRPREPTPVGVC